MFSKKSRLRYFGTAWLVIALTAMLLSACGATATNTAAPAATTAAAPAATTAAAPAATTAASTAATTAPAAAATTAASTSGQTGPAPTVAPVPNGSKVGVTDTEIVIGGSGPQSGPAAAYGVIFRAHDAYFKKINEEGGINGRKIKYLYEDDGYNPARTVETVKKLVEQDKVFALLGVLGTANNVAVADYLTEKGVPNIAPSTGSTAMFTPLRKNQFAWQLNYSTEAILLTDYMVNEQKAKTISVIYQDDPFGKEGLGAIKKAAEKYGAKVVAEVPYVLTDKDFSAQGLKIKQANADANILWSVSGPTAAVLVEMQKAGVTGKLGMSSVNNDPALYKLAGSAMDGAYSVGGTPDAKTSQDPKVVEFRSFMEKYMKSEPIGNFAMSGYIQAQLMVEALKRAGKDLTRESLFAALETFDKWNGTIAPNITYNATNHAGLNSGLVYIAKNGGFEPLDNKYREAPKL